MLDISHNNKEKKETFQIQFYTKESGETPFLGILQNS